MKKRFLALLAAGALLLTGCGAQGAANSNAEAGGDGGAEDNLHHLTVVLDWYPNALHAFLYEAQEKGYFAEQGLDVDIQSPAGVNDAMSMVAAGKADIGLYYQQDVIQARAEQNVPIKSIGAVVQGPLNIVLSLKDKNITSPKDLEGKTVGYEKWAKKFNRKEAARTVILLKEKGLGNYDDLTAHIENLSARFDALSDSIKVAEKRMVEVQALQQHIKNYRNTRQIYIEYRKSGYSKKFFEEHRQEITIHKAAKQAFDELQITKLPSMQSLYEEFHQLAVQKKQDYAEYRQIRKEKEELLIAKRTVETILNIDRQKEQEKEKEKEEKKNFR